MPKIEAAIKDAILRGARREVRTTTGGLRRDVQRLRQQVRQLRLNVTSISEVAAQWERANQRNGWTPDVSEEELKRSRLSPKLIQKLRSRLGLSQASLARLLKVSSISVLSWEHGRTEPADQNRKGLVALRKLGRRDVKRLLSRLPKPARKAKIQGPSGRRKAGKRGGRRGQVGRR